VVVDVAAVAFCEFDHAEDGSDLNDQESISGRYRES
jgi:hypothetical protein